MIQDLYHDFSQKNATAEEKKNLLSLSDSATKKGKSFYPTQIHFRSSPRFWLLHVVILM